MHSNWDNLFPQNHQPPVENLEALEAIQITQEFHQEIKYRQDFERHCQWYYQTAHRHRNEMQKMLGDFNLLGWFLRRGK